jgi:hypothetical protein
VTLVIYEVVGVVVTKHPVVVVATLFTNSYHIGTTITRRAVTLGLAIRLVMVVVMVMVAREYC